ncbi:hypothetical protein [Photorhabdus heterorhabditis]|uniref:hypothetical protein n=1 Tax=Photorhabdus heterorhabditis TaxID=880156 RepID=UPI001BD6371A|nr:hypothetical protein [Photorhabdus heterorhabditis]MBS9443678.1 hypothetical protein [Photorhabdus heterorhabditis]
MGSIGSVSTWDEALLIAAIQYPVPIPFILQVAALLAALTYPSHRVIYDPGDSLPCRRDAS